jgi:hypothetical protein
VDPVLEGPEHVETTAQDVGLEASLAVQGDQQAWSTLLLASWQSERDVGTTPGVVTDAS